MIESIKLKIMGEEKEIPSGLTFADVAKDYQDKFKYPIILAKAKNKYRELSDYIVDNDDIEFVDLKDRMGNLVYVNSLVYLASYAVTEAFGRNAKIIVKYSIDK